MTFSGEVKKELIDKDIRNRCCKLAQLGAFATFSADISYNKIVFHYDNILVAKRVENLIEILFKYRCDVRVNTQKKISKYSLYIFNKDVIKKIVSLLRTENNLGVLLRESCCKRTYIRTIFIMCGTVSDPEQNYNLECVFKDEFIANDFANMLEAFEIFGKVIIRKKYYVFYLKDSGQIVDLLNVVGAHKALLKMEQTRVYKQFRNNLNRKVNCETANLNKAVKASVKQIEDIEYIKNTVGLGYLDDNLREIAEIRLREPYLNMSAVGAMLENKLSKSGVNHRFNKIKTIADRIRKEEQK